MPIWRYIAVPLSSSSVGNRSSHHRGELAGETAADVRAALRRIGLQAIRVTPQRRAVSLRFPATSGLVIAWHRHLRQRRRSIRAEFYDSVATMVESGMPLLDVLSTLAADGSTQTRRSPRHRMLIELQEQVRSGTRLHDAMRAHTDWFSPVDLAMIDAGHRSGRLPDILRTLASREERLDALSHKLIAALTYPCLIMIVALGVAVFLSTQTLPDLTSLLVEAGLDTPRLTMAMMSTGQWLAAWWWILAILIAIGFGLTMVTSARTRTPRFDRVIARITPTTIRRKMIAGLAYEWASLVESGVPVSESLQILEPTVGRGLGRCLGRAATRLEHGDDLASALDEPLWFDTELRRMLQIGQDAGELEVMLGRIASRYQRQTDRLIDRMTSLLEPIAILFLAVVVGTVVMAAILPLLRLQEMI